MLLNLEVVSCGDILYTKTLRLFDKYLPLNKTIASSAWRWSTSHSILRAKVIDNVSLETLSTIVEKPLYAQLLGTTSCSFTAVSCEHGINSDSHNTITLTLQTLCSSGAVNAATKT
jgi:hypothetical protein